MIFINTDSLNINDLFILEGKTRKGIRNLNRYGEKFKMKDKKADCILLESLPKESIKKLYVRWVNIYNDEHFYITAIFPEALNNEQVK